MVFVFRNVFSNFQFVELSILRQCLENAMAAELSPNERDVIRLRLGLDDGKIRSVREIVEFSGGVLSMAGMSNHINV